MMWDIDRMKPLSATVVLSYFIYSELSPFYGIIRELKMFFYRRVVVGQVFFCSIM